MIDNIQLCTCVVLQGADNPDSLKRLVKKRGAKQSVSAAMQFVVDSLSAIVAWWSGFETATTQSLGPFSLAGEFLLYTLAMYLTINATLDIFGLITVGIATRKYSEQSSDMLEAVKKMAGEDITGLEVVDKARQAVVTVQVLLQSVTPLEAQEAPPALVHATQTRGRLELVLVLRHGCIVEG